MSQILHIFRKDTRRLWPEVAVSVAIVAVLVWTGPYGWRSAFMSSGSHFPSRQILTLVQCLPLLVMVTWCLLITRVVQAERLVGDTQFWLTRPYEWKKLLAAKVLFLGVFLYVPLVVVQCVLLLRAGFHPLSHVGGLIGNLLLITGVLVVPMFAIACVTSNLGRVVMTILGIVGCVAGYSALAMMWMPVNGAVLPPTLAPLVVCVCLCAVAIVLQYSMRRTSIARVVLLSVPVCLFVIAEFPFYSVDRVYARQDGDATLALAYSPRPNEGFPASLRSSKEIVFGIPVSAVEAPGHVIPVIQDVKITMEAADGTRWVSPWEGQFGAVMGKGADVTLSMPRAVYDRFRGKPLAFHLAVAVAEAHEQSSVRIPLSSPGNAVLGQGICSARSTLSANANYNNQSVTSQCRYPLRQPQLTYIVARWADPACRPSGTDGVEGSRWSGSLFSAPAYFSIDPVWVGAVIGQGISYSASGHDLPRCPASDIIFTQYELAGRVQTTVTIPDFQLPPLRSALVQ